MTRDARTGAVFYGYARLTIDVDPREAAMDIEAQHALRLALQAQQFPGHPIVAPTLDGSDMRMLDAVAAAVDEADAIRVAHVVAGEP